MNSEILIVEEAAAVLESSIVAALSSSTKHVILIGDHVQLRPKVNEYEIGKVNRLEISLFERLIRQGCPYVRLTTQRRMHPEISSLITPSIYSTLNNDPSVELYPEVSGVVHRMVFITHNKPEDGEYLDQEDDESGINRSAQNLRFIYVCRFRSSFVDDLYLPNHQRLSPLHVFLLVIGKPTHAPRVSQKEQDNSKTNTHEVIKSSHIIEFIHTCTPTTSIEFSDACILSFIHLRTTHDSFDYFCNVLQAEFTVALLQHLLLQGYKSSQLVGKSSHYILSHLITSHHIMSYHVTSCHTMFHHVISHHITPCTTVRLLLWQLRIKRQLAHFILS